MVGLSIFLIFVSFSLLIRLSYLLGAYSTNLGRPIGLVEDPIVLEISDEPDESPTPPLISLPASRVTRSATKTATKKKSKFASPVPSPPRKPGRPKKHKKMVATSSRVKLGDRVESESEPDALPLSPPKPPRARPKPVVSSKKAGKAKEASPTQLSEPTKEGSSTPPLPLNASMSDLYSAIPRLEASRVRTVEESLRDLRLVRYLILLLILNFF